MLYPNEQAMPSYITFEKNVKRTLGGFALFLGVYVAASVILSMLVGAIWPDAFEKDWYLLVMSVVPLYFMAFPCLLLFVKKAPTFTIQKAKLGASNFVLLIPITFTLLILGSIIGNVVMIFLESFFPFIATENSVESVLGGSQLLYVVILTVVVAPVMEEIVFRKILLDRVHPMGEGVSILLSGLLFGLMHGNFYQFFYATALGFLLAYIYLKTGKLRYTIAIHFIVNLFCGIISSLYAEKILAYDQMIEAAGEEMTPELMSTAILVWQAIGYVITEYYLAVMGIVVFCFVAKRLFRSIKPSPLSSFRQCRLAFLNVGTIAFTLIAMGLFVLNLLPTA